MKEKFLYYIWQYKLFNLVNLKTLSGEKITILNSGVHNKNSGPDFLNVKLEIGNLLWFGNIEIHVKSSDWYVHHHENNANYDSVILHVVYENDVEIFAKNNKLLPTLELKKYINKDLLEKYEKIFSKEARWIPCEKQLKVVDSFTLQNWFERLYLERLENKSVFITQLLDASNNDFEAVLFQLLAKNFGLKVNGSAFFNLSNSFHFSILRKTCSDESKLSALLFGQAGFLEKEIEDEYYLKLKKEYQYLKHKYKLKSLTNTTFQFFRMRPDNFPTIRLAQLTALYHKTLALFSKLMKESTLEGFYTIFSIDVHTFWKNHYTFEKESKITHKRLTKSFVELLIINTIIPLKFVYLKRKGKLQEDELLNLMDLIKPEKNATISQFEKLKINVKSAFDTQALLQLKNNYCLEKKCLNCAIGNYLLRK